MIKELFVDKNGSFKIVPVIAGVASSLLLGPMIGGALGYGLAAIAGVLVGNLFSGMFSSSGAEATIPETPIETKRLSPDGAQPEMAVRPLRTPVNASVLNGRARQ